MCIGDRASGRDDLAMSGVFSVEMKGLVSGNQQAATRATVEASNYEMRCIMQRLLLIEDDSEVRCHVQEALEDTGYRVLTAADGREGLRLFREEPVDLVLVELRTPGMDGLDLIRMLDRIRLRAKIIAMAEGMWDWEHVAVYQGAHTTLQKPFSRQELLEVVRAQLASSRPVGVRYNHVEEKRHE